MEWVDTHTHLNDPIFDGQIDDVLVRASDAGVSRLLVIGTDLTSSIKAVELAERHSGVYASVGLQPNQLNDVSPNDWKEVEVLAQLDKVVAIGETGLDRYWKTVAFDLQREYFGRHLELAEGQRRPVVIHCRDAEADVLEMVASRVQSTGIPIQGVMHSFTGEASAASTAVALGLHVSFAGMLTFKKNDALRNVARSLPLDRLLVETDSPYLSPEPMRGKRNEPARVVLTGRCLATVLGLDTETVAQATTENAIRVFGL